MAGGEFELEVKAQHWLSDDVDYDLCSHGSIAVTIAGQQIAAEDIDYGISESALAMLRSVHADHTPDKPVAERMILHGCGTILMITCPIGINWSVRHHGDSVCIGDVVRYDATNESEGRRFPDLSITLSEADYKSQITQFAVHAKEFCTGVKKSFAETWEKQMYDAFWQEFNQLLNR